LSTPGGTGQVTVNAGGSLDANELKIWSDGRLDILNGQVSADGNVVVDGGVLNMSSGPAALVLSGGAMLANQNGGTISGSGTITLGGTELVNQAIVAPGTSVGELVIEDGQYRQAASGALQIEIAGTDLSQFDVLAISGSAELAGTLDVQLIDNFQPDLGNMFEILSTTSGVNGQFATTEDQLPPLGMGLEWLIQYGANDVVLEIIAGTIPGDYNGDGTLSAIDYTVWRDALGSSIDLIADGDRSGTVDQADYELWRTNFGVAAENAHNNARVPEPTSMLLVIVAIVGAGSARPCPNQRRPLW
jgi:hypothetical protein